MIVRAARWLLAFLAVTALLPAAAGAHATVVRTTPADTAVLKSAPREVSIRWSEPVDLGDRALRLLDATGEEIATAPARHGPGGMSTAVMTLPRDLEDGTYIVAWRVVSADAHPVSGAFSFSVGAPSAVVVDASGAASGVVAAVDGIARAVAFLGLAISVGGAFLVLVLWPEGPANRRARRVLWTGASALLGGSLAVLLLQGPYASGGGLGGIFSPSLVDFSLSTRFGRALALRLLLAAAFAALVAVALRRDRARDPAILVPAAVCALGMLATWTLTDHSRTGVQTWLGIPVATVHLLAMALWFGGLVVLLTSVLRTPPASLEPVVPRFSRLALICFTVLVASGLYLAWRQVGTLAALPATGFGRLLLIKTGIVVAILALAVLSRRAVGRGGGDLARRLRRSVAGEAFLGVAVLGVTATLVNTAPARVSYANPIAVTVPAPGGAGTPFEGGRVQVRVDPAKQGPNVLDLYLVARDGTLYQPPELTARLLPPGAGVGPLPVELASAEPGHFVASRMTVPFPGRWTLRLTIRTSDIDEDAVQIPLEIR